MLVNPAIASNGTEIAWLSLLKDAGFIEKSRDGEGRLGDEDMVIIDRDGEDATDFGLAGTKVAQRKMRPTRESGVSFTVPAIVQSRIHMRACRSHYSVAKHAKSHDPIVAGATSTLINTSSPRQGLSLVQAIQIHHHLHLSTVTRLLYFRL